MNLIDLLKSQVASSSRLKTPTISCISDQNSKSLKTRRVCALPGALENSFNYKIIHNSVACRHRIFNWTAICHWRRTLLLCAAAHCADSFACDVAANCLQCIQTRVLCVSELLLCTNDTSPLHLWLFCMRRFNFPPRSVFFLSIITAKRMFSTFVSDCSFYIRQLAPCWLWRASVCNYSAVKMRPRGSLPISFFFEYTFITKWMWTLSACFFSFCDGSLNCRFRLWLFAPRMASSCLDYLRCTAWHRIAWKILRSLMRDNFWAILKEMVAIWASASWIA